MRKPKILILTSTFPRWLNDSDPPFVYELSRRLVKSFSVVVLAPHFPGSRTHEKIEGVEVYRYRYFFSKFERLAGHRGILPTLKRSRFYFLIVPFFILSQLLFAAYLSYRTKPDVIHAHWIIPQGFTAAVISFFSKIPFVVTAHGSDVFGLNGRLLTRIKALIIGRAARVTVVSGALCQVLTGNRRMDKLKIIPMGVDGRRFFQIRDFCGDVPVSPRLIFVGRFSEKKGVVYLLRAMPEIIREFPRVLLKLVGKGELEVELRHMVKDLKIEGSVEFCGALSNTELPTCYASSDIFVGPSDSEGFGLTFVEASMAGCLVIGTNVGGIADIIQDGKTGFLVPEKDSEAIAEKVIHALHNWHEMRLVRQAAQRYCLENFDWQVISKRYALLLEEAIEAGECVAG